MATLKLQGLEEYERKISKLGRETEKICGEAIYAGAAIAADEIRKGIEALPVIRGYGTADTPLPGGVTSAQKQGLLDGLGITPLSEKDGFYNVKIGFDGYNRTKTKAHPQGQPNQLVARGVESGTSWKQKKPFVRPAVNNCKKSVEAKMAETIDKQIEHLMK